jgi:hypothetical protein
MNKVSGNVELSPEIVAGVLVLLARNTGTAEIKKQTGVSRQQVWHIKNENIGKKLLSAARLLLATTEASRPVQDSNSAATESGGSETTVHGIPVALRSLDGQDRQSSEVGSPPNGVNKNEKEITVKTNPLAVVVIPSGRLTPDEKSELASRKDKIMRGWATFLEVANALLEIKTMHLFREHGTFEDYCRKELGFSKTHANRQISAARVARAVRGECSQPLTESLLRPLTSFRNDFSILNHWRAAVREAKARGCALTAEVVNTVVLKSKSNKSVAAYNKLKRKPGYTHYHLALNLVDRIEDAVKGADNAQVFEACVKLRGALRLIELEIVSRNRSRSKRAETNRKVDRTGPHPDSLKAAAQS